MNTVGRDETRRFRRVQEFVASHPLADAPASLGRQASELDDVVSQLTKMEVDQEAGHRQTKAETRRQKGLRAELWVNRPGIAGGSIS